jgi:hypothetical protein
MPRRIRDVRLQSPEARQKLEPAKEPYWRELPEDSMRAIKKFHETGTWWLREIRGASPVLALTTYKRKCRSTIETQGARRGPAAIFRVCQKGTLKLRAPSSAPWSTRADRRSSLAPWR